MITVADSQSVTDSLHSTAANTIRTRHCTVTYRYRKHTTRPLSMAQPYARTIRIRYFAVRWPYYTTKMNYMYV